MGLNSWCSFYKKPNLYDFRYVLVKRSSPQMSNCDKWVLWSFKLDFEVYSVFIFFPCSFLCILKIPWQKVETGEVPCKFTVHPLQGLIMQIFPAWCLSLLNRLHVFETIHQQICTIWPHDNFYKIWNLSSLRCFQGWEDHSFVVEDWTSLCSLCLALWNSSGIFSSTKKECFQFLLSKISHLS